MFPLLQLPGGAALPAQGEFGNLMDLNWENKPHSLVESLKRNSISPGLFGCLHMGFATFLTQCGANLCLKMLCLCRIGRDDVSRPSLPPPSG